MRNWWFNALLVVELAQACHLQGDFASTVISRLMERNCFLKRGNIVVTYCVGSSISGRGQHLMRIQCARWHFNSNFAIQINVPPVIIMSTPQTFYVTVVLLARYGDSHNGFILFAYCNLSQVADPIYCRNSCPLFIESMHNDGGGLTVISLIWILQYIFFVNRIIVCIILPHVWQYIPTHPYMRSSPLQMIRNASRIYLSLDLLYFLANSAANYLHFSR